MTLATSDEILTQESTNLDDGLKAPSPPQNGTVRTRRGITQFIPPLRGDSGGCAFLFFCLFFFTKFGIYRIEKGRIIEST
jgi:hypothetical protein